MIHRNFAAGSGWTCWAQRLQCSIVISCSISLSEMSEPSSLLGLAWSKRMHSSCIVRICSKLYILHRCHFNSLGAIDGSPIQRSRWLLFFNCFKLRCPLKIIHLIAKTNLFSTRKLRLLFIPSKYLGSFLRREIRLNILCIMLLQASFPVIHQLLDKVV